MNRRKFLRRSARAGAGVAAVVSAFAAPAIAQSMPEVKWRLTSSFPKNLDTLYGAAERLSGRVAAITDNKFQIRVFAAGEVVPGLQALDAVQQGNVEVCHTAAYYYIGKDPTFAFDTSVAFGLNTRQMNAWLYAGGGRELMNEFFKDYNIHAIPCGNTGAQMGGWFRKEIKTVADLNGLKMRIGGFAGNVMAKLGLVAQQIPGGEIYPALEKGTIDAAEWVGPYDDEKLGFHKVAPFYYYPGWWEGSTNISAYVNIKQWESLSPENKAILEAACSDAHVYTSAKYDHLNPAALKKLIAGGTKLRAFPTVVMDACLKAANELYAETSAANPKFKKVFDAWSRYRDEQYQWTNVAEFGFDNYVLRNRTKMAPPAK